MSPAQATPSDELILAAARRAERHSRKETRSVSHWDVLQHLALYNRRTKAAREVRARLEAMTAEGVIEHAKCHGMIFWSLTEKGRRVAGANSSLVLPESPQHRQWRVAREDAPSKIERSRDRLGDALREAEALLAEDQASSDAWFLASIRFSEACVALASATYCLREWLEPDDTQADVDERSEPATVAATAEEFERLIGLRHKRRKPALKASEAADATRTP